MRITLRWGRSRDHQLVALLGCGGVRAVRLGGFRHHAAQLDDGAGKVRSLLLRAVRGWSFCGGMGHGAHPAVKSSSQLRLPQVARKFVSGYRFSDTVIPPK